MTNDEYQLIADVLRYRINEITKMFEDGGYVPKENVPYFTRGQIRLLALDLEHAFRQKEPALKVGIFTDAVRDQNVTTPTEPVWGWASGDPGHR